MSEIDEIPLHYDRSDARRLLEDPDTEAVALYCLALHAIGVDALHGEDAEMLEVYLDLEHKFGAKLPLETENKLQAVSLLVGTDAFFESAHAMHAISVTLTQGDFEVGEDFSVDRASWEEMHWAAFCASLLRAEDEEAHFENRVLKDMLLALNESGPGPETEAELQNFMKERKSRLADDLKILGISERHIQLEFQRAQK